MFQTILSPLHSTMHALTKLSSGDGEIHGQDWPLLDFLCSGYRFAVGPVDARLDCLQDTLVFTIQNIADAARLASLRLAPFNCWRGQRILGGRCVCVYFGLPMDKHIYMKTSTCEAYINCENYSILELLLPRILLHYNLYKPAAANRIPHQGWRYCLVGFKSQNRAVGFKSQNRAIKTTPQIQQAKNYGHIDLPQIDRPNLVTELEPPQNLDHTRLGHGWCKSKFFCFFFNSIKPWINKFYTNISSFTVSQPGRPLTAAEQTHLQSEQDGEELAFVPDEHTVADTR